MSLLTVLGTASEDTRGQFFHSSPIDSYPIDEEGVLYRSAHISQNPDNVKIPL